MTDSQRGFLVVMGLFFVWLAVRQVRMRRRERALTQVLDAQDELPSVQIEPPRDVHDAAAWDKYWEDQVSHPTIFGLTLMFAEMFARTSALVKVMQARGMTRVLCVGHGISREPAALARAGLSVVGLDLSARTAEIARQLRLDDESLHRFMEPGQEASGGQLEFVTGDLMDPGICPGPFDVIIERRTLQLFGDEKEPALEALAARLATPGILLSQWHHGAWRPHEPRTHPLEQWFVDNGWPLYPGGDEGADFTGRVAWLEFTTG